MENNPNICVRGLGKKKKLRKMRKEKAPEVIYFFGASHTNHQMKIRMRSLYRYLSRRSDCLYTAGDISGKQVIFSVKATVKQKIPPIIPREKSSILLHRLDRRAGSRRASGLFSIWQRVRIYTSLSYQSPVCGRFGSVFGKLSVESRFDH